MQLHKSFIRFVHRCKGTIFLSLFFVVSENLSIFANGEERIRSSRRSVMHELRMKTWETFRIEMQ